LSESKSAKRSRKFSSYGPARSLVENYVSEAMYSWDVWCRTLLLPAFIMFFGMESGVHARVLTFGVQACLV
jgi:hypothetical protein